MRKLFGLSNRRWRRGHAFLELALFSPVIFFQFVGTLDVGFYSYALVCTESAARVAAEATSASNALAGSSSAACTAALGVMTSLPNYGRMGAGCNAMPLSVTATAVTASDGSPASQVAVKYQTDNLIPIPGLLTGQLTVRRVVEMRVRS